MAGLETLGRFLFVPCSRVRVGATSQDQTTSEERAGKFSDGETAMEISRPEACAAQGRWQRCHRSSWLAINLLFQRGGAT